MLDRLQVNRVRGHSYLPGFLGLNSVVLDLGANHGGNTAAMVAHGASVTAVEANPTLMDDITSAGATRVIKAAVTAHSGNVTFSIADNDEASSLLTDDGVKVTIEGRRLEDILAELPEHLDLMKVDIEGAETAMFLDAAQDDLKRIDQICVEFHDAQGMTSRSELRAVNRVLRRAGFWRQRFIFEDRSDVLYLNRRIVGPLGSLLWRFGVLYAFIGRRLRRLGSR
jgi:FkbM family methyltransferase